MSAVCEYHMRGECRFGSQCRRSHDLEGFPYKEFFEALTANEFQFPPDPLNAGPQTLEEMVLRVINAELAVEQSMTNSTSSQPGTSRMTTENAATGPTVEMKTEKVNSEGENASNFHALHQKRMKEKPENDGSGWDNIMMSAIDRNLLCNICFEIFIKPTVLNCSHTFCESCIDVWTIRVINCPICRVEVKSKSHCLSLETFIENIVQHLPEEFKIKREAAIKDREMKKTQRPQRANQRGRGRSPGLLSFMRQREATALLRQNQPMAGQNVTFFLNGGIFEQPDIFGTNSSARGVTPVVVVSHALNPEEQTSNRRTTQPHNPSTSH